MRRRSRAGSVKPRRRKPAAPKRPGGTAAVRPRSASVASPDSEAARLASELSAMNEILRLISNSPSNVTTVLQSVAEQAAYICQAEYVAILLVENDELHDAAWFGELTRTPAFPLDRSTVAGRSVCEMRPISVDDVQNVGDEFPRGREIGRMHGVRSIIAVPLIRESRALGTIVVRRTEVRPFDRKHIDLLTNFAAQAVIAIENARLLNELRQRTTDLSESLEQQTAASEVLKVISSSPGNLQPVFYAMLESAARLCDASFGNIFRWEDDALRLVATYNTPAAFVEARSQFPLRRNQDNPIGEMLAAKTVLHVHDLAADERYTKRRDPNIIAAVELGGIRTCLAVPMLKDNKLIGALIVYRQEVRPFSDKQIELVKNFAAQAVIAIDNARLLNELRESLDRQTATADILRVIASTPEDSKHALDTIAEAASHMFGVANVNFRRIDGDVLRIVSSAGHTIERLRKALPDIPLEPTDPAVRCFLDNQQIPVDDRRAILVPMNVE